MHGITDDGECVRTDLAARGDVVGFVEVALVDFGLRHEAGDIDRVGAFDLDGFQLVLIDRDVVSFAELVAPALVFGINNAAGLLIDHLLAQAMAGAGVDLVKVGFLGLRGGGEKLDRAGHEG